MINNPLLDVDFLKTLSEQRERTVYARIVALSMQEEPMDEISGKVTQGSITIDGNSSVRRTFSLSLVADDININDYYWGLHTKIKLYIGLKNLINKDYDDIIWFKQGTYILSSFNTTQSVNSYSISIQGKDKMCKLNGELGGMVESLTADFGKLTSYSRGANGKLVTQKEDIPIKTIIKEVVHKYGNEPFQNIIINDLDDYGLELMEYRGDRNKPLYMLINLYTNEVENVTFDGEKEYYNVSTKKNIRLKDIPNYDPRMNQNFSGEPAEITEVKSLDGTSINDDIIYSIGKIEYGETCGYRLTDLTYAGDLTAKVGDSITSVLDKIKTMLGEFEYFYDIDGHFVFQKKKTYIQTAWNGIIDDGKVDSYVLTKLTEKTYVKNMFYVKINGGYTLSIGGFSPTAVYYEKIDGAHTSSAIDTSDTMFFFGDSNLVTSFNNTPNLANLKNDFSIWGAKKSSSSDKTIPIHLRYAIDKKPYKYTTYDGLKTFTTEDYEKVVADLGEKYQNGKTQNPNGLPEEWWDVHEWADLYRLRTGAYPKDTVGTYCTATKVKIFDYFSQGGPYAGDNDTVVTTDDIFYYTDSNIIAEMHGVCGHTYSFYISQAQNGIGAYIHDPQIPEKVLETIDDHTLYDGEVEIIAGIDWREIIYQMALDYNAHCHEDDFMIKIYNNNEGIFNEDGTTGYESYYTDMEGFWRTLYDPNPPIAGGAAFIDLIDRVMLKLNTGSDANPDDSPGFITNLEMKSLGEKYYQYFKKDLDKEGYVLKTLSDYDNETAYSNAIKNFWLSIKEQSFPDDSLTEFYVWDSENQNYSKGKFEDHVNLIDLPSLADFKADRLYQSSGNTYFELYHYEEYPFYLKQNDINLINLKEDKIYYACKANETINETNCNSYLWSYKSNGRVNEAQYLKDKNHQNDYFAIGYKYYEYMGYQRVSTLKKGVKYFKKLEDGSYDTENFLYLDPDQTYYSEDPGLSNTEIRVQAFTKGHTYYTKDGSQSFTYNQNDAYYESIGFKEVLDLTKCSFQDQFFYYENGIDLDGKEVSCNIAIVQEPYSTSLFFPIGKSISHYKRIFSYDIKNGRYYPLHKTYDVDSYENSANKNYKDACVNKILEIINLSNYDSELEKMKSDMKTYHSIEFIELAELDARIEINEQALKSKLDDMDKKYEDMIAEANKNHTEVIISEKEYEDDRNYEIDIVNKKNRYLTSLKYASSFKNYEVIRNYEYGKRYFTKRQIGSSYEFVRKNCYQFKDRNALYDAPTYNIDTGWAMDLQNDPANLIFWFDFLDTDGEVSKYNVHTVGNRPKGVNDEKVKAIYYRDTPNVIFVNADEWEEKRDVKPGYTYVKLTYDVENLFNITGKGKTAHGQLEDFLYQFTYCTETISMTTIPVYHLQPNTRIAVRDEKSHINGDYIINRLTIPLTYNGTMNISATKAADAIY